MRNYLSTHYEPQTPTEVIEKRWSTLAVDKRSIWVKTWFHRASGKRFCWWNAPNRETLETVFSDHGVPWKDIIEVKHTTPAEWRWRED
jgi:Nickel responsive protein SCO4226-like